MSSYVELQVTSDYSFLRGASHVEELLATAAVMGMTALAITDRHSLAGIARAHQRAAEAKIRLVVGCRLDLVCGMALLVYPMDRPAYSRLCRLLTLGKGRAGKGACRLDVADFAAAAEGMIAILLPGDEDRLERDLMQLRDLLGDRLYLALTVHRRPGDAVRLQALADRAALAGVATVATGDVLYHLPERRMLQDVMTCIREGCTIDAAGFRRERFADRYLKTPEEMGRLFARHPDAVARTLEIANRCRFSLDELRYQYPDERERDDETAQQTLERLSWAGAAGRYAPPRFPGGIPDEVTKQIKRELALIADLGYAPYFLTVHNIVRFARSRDILCQGRGSAANSSVCYVLGITSIDPVESGLLFERFVSAERHEPPDIDVDFEHERREEVIQWVYDTYGRERAALCATIIRYRSRGAIRDVGKALGLPEDVTGALSSQIWGWSNDGVDETHARALNLNVDDRRLRLTLDLAKQLIGFPRHLSQHPGGFVLTRDRLDDLVPIEPAAMKDRQVIEWDKDDIDILRFMKVDVLGLGMLGCMRRAFDLLEEHRGERRDLATIPEGDAPTFAMIRRADTLGVFQIESRAQMSMLPRLKPKKLYDLVIQVAIVRPGPIQGDMVHPYLRRRENKEKPDYPKPELERLLKKTLGIPLFQEQAMQVAIHCAGFSPSEADRLRRSMATFKVTGGVSEFEEKLVGGMVARGYERDFAQRTFRQLEGFGSYGFPESHAASFAKIAYASSWMKCHHPDIFCVALLNAQPMGFYAPAQIVRDARDHGVEVRPVSVDRSRWDCTLEPASGRYLAVRLGLRMAKGLGNAEGADLVVRRADTPFASVEECRRRTGLAVASLERLAEADAFSCLGLDRRQALWAVKGLDPVTLPLFAAAAAAETLPAPEIVEPPTPLAAMSDGAEVVEDYRSTGLTLRRHPVAFLRADLDRRGMIRCADLPTARDRRRVAVAGIVLVRQRPGSAKGVMFITIEDESGVANLVLWPQLFERQRRLVLSARMIGCHGRVQREGQVIHVVTERLEDLSDLLGSVAGRGDGEGFPLARGRGDAATHGGGDDPHERRTGPGGILQTPPRDIYIPLSRVRHKGMDPEPDVVPAIIPKARNFR